MLMRHAHLQLTEIKRMEWDELAWVYQELIKQMVPKHGGLQT